MKSARKVAVALALLALAGAGCGGDDSEEGSAGGSSKESSTGSGSGGTSSGGVAEPGAEFKIGDTARVRHRPNTAPVNSKKTYLVDATVVEVEQASVDDLKDVNLDAEQKRATPYFVKVRLRNRGEEIPVSRSDDPDVHFVAVDDRGQEQSSLIIIGTFERCENETAPKPFATGKSYESCFIYLVPGGGSIREVRWRGTIEYITDPVVWK
jgi:hypothetical protein